MILIPPLSGSRERNIIHGAAAGRAGKTIRAELKDDARDVRGVKVIITLRIYFSSFRIFDTKFDNS